MKEIDVTDGTHCSYEDCTKPRHGHGWCAYHYNRWFRTGSPKPPPRRNFWDLVDKAGPGGCWLWLGLKNESGYGRIEVGGRNLKAHRRAYELTVGPIPDGLTIDHLCRTKACVNPRHLEPVTLRENLARAHKARAKRTA